MRIFHLRALAAFLFMVIIYPTAKAAEIVISVPQASVYREASPNSEVITTVYKGDKVKVSNKPYPGFVKVMVGNQMGFIMNSDLRAAGGAGKKSMPMQTQQKQGPGGTLRNRMSFGLFAGVDYQSQGTRTNTDASGGVENFGMMSGIGTRFGGSLQFAFSPRLSAKIYGEMKSVLVSGTGTYTPPAGAATPVDMFLREQFIGIGAMGQYYFGNKFWGGVGGQYDIVSSGTLKVGSTDSTLDSSQRVNFIFMYGAVGFDFPLSRKIFLITDMRIGALFSRPLILEGDATLSFAYAF